MSELLLLFVGSPTNSGHTDRDRAVSRCRGWVQGITGSSFPQRCANQNNTKIPTEKHCSAQSTSDENATPPNTAPRLFPPSKPLGRRGPRQGGPWLWLSAWPWPWPGLEATRGRGASSRWLALHGSGQSARRAACVPRGQGVGSRSGRSGRRAGGGCAWEPPRATPCSASRGQT